MVKFRKFLAVVYVISFILAVGALSSYWFNVEPIASFMADNRGQTWLDYFLCATLGIAAIGAVVLLVRTLTLRSKKSFQRSKNEYGTVQISRATMVREVNAVLDKHPEVKRLKTFVTIKNRRRKPYVDVAIRVSPRGSLEMPEVASALQSEVKAALERLTGNAVHTVTVDVRKGTTGDDASSGKISAENAEDAAAASDSVPEEQAIAVEDAAIGAEGSDGATAGRPVREEPADAAEPGADAPSAGDANADAAPVPAIASSDGESTEAAPETDAHAHGDSAASKAVNAVDGVSAPQDDNDSSTE